MNLLVNLHKFGHHFGIKLSEICLELSEMLNYPAKDTLKILSVILKSEHTLQVEWTLELGHKLSFANEGSLLGLISTVVHGCFFIIF